MKKYMLCLLGLMSLVLWACKDHEEDSIEVLENKVLIISQELDQVYTEMMVLSNAYEKDGFESALLTSLDDSFHTFLERVQAGLAYDYVTDNIQVQGTSIKDLYLDEVLDLPDGNFGLRIYTYGFTGTDQEEFQIAYEIRLRSDQSSLENIFVVFKKIDDQWYIDSLEKDLI